MLRHLSRAGNRLWAARNSTQSIMKPGNCGVRMDLFHRQILTHYVLNFAEEHKHIFTFYQHPIIIPDKGSGSQTSQWLEKYVYNINSLTVSFITSG